MTAVRTESSSQRCHVFPLPPAKWLFIWVVIVVVGAGAALVPAHSSSICAVQGCWEGEGVITWSSSWMWWYKRKVITPFLIAPNWWARGCITLCTFFRHVLLIRIFLEVKMQELFSWNFTVLLLFTPFFPPRVVRFEIVRLTTQIKVNDVTDGAGRKQIFF